MKKFKLFFYPIYILSVLLTLYFSFGISFNTSKYFESIPDNAAIPDLAKMIFIPIIFVGILMAVEIVVENLHIIRLRSELKKAEKEVLAVKAKLYDDSQVDTSYPTHVETDTWEKEEEGDDNENFKSE